MAKAGAMFMACGCRTSVQTVHVVLCECSLCHDFSFVFIFGQLKAALTLECFWTKTVQIDTVLTYRLQ